MIDGFSKRPLLVVSREKLNMLIYIKVDVYNRCMQEGRPWKLQYPFQNSIANTVF